MGAIDYGTQTISVDYYDPADSHIVNLRHMGVRRVGIYSGGYLTKVSNVAVSLSALICEVKDSDYQVKVETAATVASVTVGVATPYVVLRWAYTGAVDNYMDVLGVAEGSIQDNDLVVGKCNFSGATLTGFDYSERTTPEVFDLFLKVDPTVPASMTVRVRAGSVNFGSENFDIVDQVTSAIAAPGSGSRIDLIYVDTDGVVKIKAGTADPSPSAPDYEGKAVLAEVTIASTATEITEDDIKRVRAFIVTAGADLLSYRSGDLLMSSHASPPSGFSDVSVTYADKFIRISSGTPLDTGGSDTHTTPSHVLTVDEMPAHTHTETAVDWKDHTSAGNESERGGHDLIEDTGSTGGGSGHTHGAADNVPCYIQVKMYSKN